MYNFVEVMVNEHVYINRMSAVVKAALNEFIRTGTICVDDFRAMHNFIREYADAFHHGKEEVFLFKEMEQNMGEDGKVMINDVMLPEHVMGRRFMKNLNLALDKWELAENAAQYDAIRLEIIAAAGGWAFMINEHIYKEDYKVFPFVDRNLDHDKVAKMQQYCDAFDKELHKLGIPAYHIGKLVALEQKYLFADMAN